MSDVNVGESVPVGDDFLDRWLETGTVAQRSVVVYGRPDLFAEYEDLERQLRVAEQAAKGDQSLGETGVDTIIEEMERVYGEWMESKTTWFIRALTEDEQAEARKAGKFPKDLPDDATEAQKAKHEKQTAEAASRVNCAAISKALVKIENHKGEVVATSITPEQVDRFRQRLGERQMVNLIAASMVASSEDAEIPVPFSRRSSETDRS